MKNLLIIARYEFVSFLRSKYIQLLSVIFLLLTIFISYFGAIGAGYRDFLGMLRTAGTLFNLILITFPLISLIMGTISFTTDRAYMELLLSQPLRRFEIFAGKYLGVFLSLFVSTIAGFGVAGIMISYYSGMEGLKGYLITLLISLVISSIFLSLSTIISIPIRQRGKSLGVSFLIWVFSVIIYDLLVIGISIIIGGNQVNLLTIFSLFFNPVDIARIWGFQMIGAESFLGPSGSYLLSKLGGEYTPLVLGIAFIFWVIFPILISYKVFKNQDF